MPRCRLWRSSRASSRSYTGATQMSTSLRISNHSSRVFFRNSARKPSNISLQGAAEVGVEVRLQAADAQPAPVLRLVDVVEGGAAVEHCLAGTGHGAAGQALGDGEGEEVEDAVGHGDVDVLGAARLLAGDEGGEDGGGGVKTAGGEGSEDVWGGGRGA